MTVIDRSTNQKNPSQHVINIPEEVKTLTEKCMIVIDGSNVAYKHSVEKKEFSVKGLSICIDYFKKRGHDVKVVIPEFRMKIGKSTDPETIKVLYSQGIVILTPNKSYDDRFVLDIAIEFNGVVISNDKFRDIINESEGNSTIKTNLKTFLINCIFSAYKNLIESRVIGYTWCNDVFMLPQDPYGRFGPKLNDILGYEPLPYSPKSKSGITPKKRIWHNSQHHSRQFSSNQKPKVSKKPKLHKPRAAKKKLIRRDFNESFRAYK